MDGIGSVTTSSPTSPVTGAPLSSKLATLQPRHRHWISPARTGSVGPPPMNAVNTSVPPLMEARSRSLLTRSYTQANPSGGNGAPVEPMERIALRSSAAPGSTPAFIQPRMYGALTPNAVMRVRSATRHSAYMSGWAGLPSYTTMDAPSSRPLMRMFHMIQPVVLNQKKRSPSPMSIWSERNLACSSSAPPCPCTIAFGMPVVPDEYATQSGWSNGTGSNVSAPPGTTNSAQSDVAPSSGERSGWASRYGSTTVRSSVGSAAWMPATASRESNRLPP